MKFKKVASWCLYDFGSTGFSTVVMATLLPALYNQILWKGSNTGAVKSWGVASSLALLISAVLTPFIGLWADRRAVKKRGVLAFALAGALSSGALAFLRPGDWLWALGCVVAGTVAMALAQVCYDALLPSVAPPHLIDQVSTAGYGLGYFGGGLLLAFDLWLLQRWNLAALPWIFLSVAVWWALFCIPLALNVPEPPTSPTGQGGWRDLPAAWRDLRRHKEAFRFLIAFWLYNDGIGTVTRMAAVYGAALGLSPTTLVTALLVTQFLGLPAAFLVAWMAKKLGTKKVLSFLVAWYGLICFAGLGLSKPWHFWAMAVAVALAQGGSQSLSRSLFGSMIPPSESGRFFGFYNLSSKFAGVVGPALCGIVAAVTGSVNWAIAIMGLSFIGGLLILKGVDVEKGRARIHPVNQ